MLLQTSIKRIQECSSGVLSSFLLMSASFNVHAAVIHVTDPSTDASSNGLCSLIEAIDNANADAQAHLDCPAGAGADTIVLQPDTTYQLTRSNNSDFGPTGLPVIRSTITIEGNGSIVRARGARLLVVDEGADLTINKLSLRDGMTAEPPIHRSYRNVVGSGVLNFGSLTLTDCEVRNNQGHQYDGGGIGSLGTLSITNCVIADNFAYFGGGGIAGEGALTITDSVIENNVSFNNFWETLGGGGILWRGGHAVIRGTTIASNGGMPGGGVLNAGTMSIVSSTIHSNESPSQLHDWVYSYPGGGGIANQGSLTLVNSTISGNTAEWNASSISEGGGILNYPSGHIQIVNSTIFGNSAALGSSLYNHEGGELDLQNSILAGLGSNICVNEGAILTNIANLIEDGSCAAAFTGDARLEPLADNGGQTLTHALQPTSPAIDSGDNVVCAALPVGNLDQRGMPRPVDGNGDGFASCDIGAYEAQETYPICEGRLATIYVDSENVVRGGFLDGKPFRGILLGTRGDDVILGTPGDDVIAGMLGNDIICGNGGNDRIHGGS